VLSTFILAIENASSWGQLYASGVYGKMLALHSTIGFQVSKESLFFAFIQASNQGNLASSVRHREDSCKWQLSDISPPSKLV
jgi:hypothetical protein